MKTQLFTLRIIFLSTLLGILLTSCTNLSPKNTVIILATTTSTYDSGLLDAIIPGFENNTGYRVKMIAVGTGKALQMGERGDADILLVHAPSAEKVLVENGAAIERKLVMHNDFVIVGPPGDPAGIKGVLSPSEVFSQIATSTSTFISRGDDSGTNKKEKSIWKIAEMTPEGDWYLESGQGMGATLRLATEKIAYTLTDRATYLALADTLDLEILVEGDPSLMNIYHVMLVNPDKHASVNVNGARALSDFFLSQETQDKIEVFGISEYGQPLFFPDAGKTEADFNLE